uniref:Uncharacterized protein n=1 Tax=Anopheles quadriannulatus TaxID=34691 RepID=A0A182X317_ANOQN
MAVQLTHTVTKMDSLKELVIREGKNEVLQAIGESCVQLENLSVAYLLSSNPELLRSLSNLANLRHPKHADRRPVHLCTDRRSSESHVSPSQQN